MHVYRFIFVVCVCSIRVWTCILETIGQCLPQLLSTLFIIILVCTCMSVCMCTCVYVHRHARDTVRMWKSELWILAFFFIWDMIPLAFHCVELATWTVSF